MSIKAKEFELSIDFNSTVPQSLDFMRADAVSLKFDFGDYDDSGASKMRVFAYMNAAHEYAFGAEFEKSGEDWIAEFTSSQTAGYSGAAVMTVQLLDADENQVNSANINLFLGESNSTEPFTPSENFRDEVMDALSEAQEAATNAANSAQNAQTNQELATSAANSASAFANAAQSSQNACASLKSDCEALSANAQTSADSAEASASSASEAKNEAVQAAEEAKAISDPDGLLQKHDSEISALQASKANVGEHLFNSGKIVGDISFPNFPFSICITYELDNFSTSASQVLFQAVAANGQRIVLFTSTTNKLVLDISSSTATTRRYLTLSNDLLGKHSLIWIARSLTNANNPDWVLYLDGKEVETIVSNTAYTTSDVSGNRPYAVNTTADALVGSAASTNPISIYDLKLFNFDMSAEDAPYTVQDYAEGVLPSLLLKQGTLSTPDPTMGASTGSGWNITSTPSATGSTTNGLWRVGNANLNYCANTPSEELPEGVAYGVDLATKGMSNMEARLRLVDDASYSMVKYAGKSVWVRCSFMYRKTPANVYGNTNLRVGFYTNWLVDVPSSDVTDNNWHTYDEIFKVSVGSTLKYTSQGMVGLCNAGNPTVTGQPMWSIAEFNWEVLGEALELADSRSAYQIKDLSGNGNHATIFGEVLSRYNENPTAMQIEYTWGSGVSTGAYIMGDTVTLPANAEIEVLAKSSASATLSLGTSSSATTTFANAASVGTTAKSIAKFYTADAAQKLFATPSVAGLTINLTLKITSLK